MTPGHKLMLTARERQVAELVARGWSNKELAKALGLSFGSVKVYLSRIYRKWRLQGSGNSRVRLTLTLRLEQELQASAELPC